MRIATLLVLAALLLFAVPAHAQGNQFVGQIDIVGFNFAPNGWAICDGQIMSIADNAVLFDLIGTTYGGDGMTTFALPDLRGRMAIHQGQGPGLANYIVGQMGGEEQVTLTLSQLPNHTHLPMGSSSPANALSPSSAVWATTTTFLYSSTGTPVPMTAAIGATGGGGPHENRPPFLAMNFIISLFGIFPSQN
jgi:microcystin-dependent protein